MSGNSFGKLFSVTTFGESHGKAIGCIVDGCPPGYKISEKDIQPDLNRRKPGQSKYTTQRREDDKVEILSGTFEGITTGTPIMLIIHNIDQRSRDYSEIKNKFRPGHADFTYQQKYGLRDYRGAGRSSARETVARVAAGAIAKDLNSRRLLLMTDVEGVLDKNKKLISEVNSKAAERMLKDGDISGGMIPKINTCLDAVNNGVTGVVIVDGRKSHSILFELFSDKGAGTLIRKWKI